MFCRIFLLFVASPIFAAVLVGSLSRAKKEGGGRFTWSGEKGLHLTERGERERERECGENHPSFTLSHSRTHGDDFSRCGRRCGSQIVVLLLLLSLSEDSDCRASAIHFLHDDAVGLSF